MLIEGHILFVDTFINARFLGSVRSEFTLTHSDFTGELFLSIGYVYDFDAIDKKMRDEVIAKWQKNSENEYVLCGKVYISGGEFNPLDSSVRFNVFQREMDTALQGMINGDRPFYDNYPTFLDAPICIYYDSIYPQFRGATYYGTPRQYLNHSDYITKRVL